jgi:hypothetical protein
MRQKLLAELSFYERKLGQRKDNSITGWFDLFNLHRINILLNLLKRTEAALTSETVNTNVTKWGRKLDPNIK